MKLLLFFVVALITYGSLYPFNFEPLNADANTFALLLQTWNVMTHRGDVLANIVLFIPLGLIGILALAENDRQGGAVLIVLLLGLVVGVALQFGQIYLPSRDSNLTDAIWNFLGTSIGISIGYYWRNALKRSSLSLDNSLVVPMLLVASWLCYRLMPFIPSIDWQQFKNSVKPLLLNPEFSWIGVFHDSVAWAIVCSILLTIIPRRNITLYILLGLPAVFCLEVLIIENVITLSNLVGAVLGIGFGWMLRIPLRQVATILASLLFVLLLTNGLVPFNIRLMPTIFHWVPFHGFLGGSMLLNTTVLFEKFFFYGAFLWLLMHLGIPLVAATAIGFVVTLGIEITQIGIGTHTAEITDPLLMVMLGVCISVFNSGRNHLIAEPTSGASRYSLRLKPGTTLLSSQLPVDGIDVKSMPFCVGRFEGQGESPQILGNRISLIDSAPFQVSRKHFAIERNSAGLIVRDNGSALGTVVNGVQIGIAIAESDVALLNVGNNEIVVGGPRSKFRFDAVVEAVII